MTNANTRGAVGHCLEIHDLLAAKYVARREKDRRFCGDAARRGLADRAVLLERIESLALDEERKRIVLGDVHTDFA